jgi:hypothetical protein
MENPQVKLHYLTFSQPFTDVRGCDKVKGGRRKASFWEEASPSKESFPKDSLSSRRIP